MKLIGCPLLLQALLAVFTDAQAPNTVAKNHPSLRTQSINGTIFIIPIPKASAASLASPYDLLPLPSGSGTVFPNGFPAGMHPVVIDTFYGNDIRQTVASVPLFIDALLGAAAIMPFVDRLGDGKTAFNKPIANFIGGVNGMDVMGLVPALVGSAEGTALAVGSFEPDTQAYKSLSGTSPQQYSSEVKQVILPNPLSGPGISPSAIDLLFHAAKTPIYPARTFNRLLNQPATLTTGQCQLNAYYFNESFANPQLRTGTVVLYSPALPTELAGSQGGAKTYDNAAGYNVVAEIVGYNAQACSKFA